ncbi:MAG: hypothetical protein P4L40_17000 [Terracidiphilus sp.]|nr:hypothetical protein [Terracidiphilus sp.]
MLTCARSPCPQALDFNAQIAARDKVVEEFGRDLASAMARVEEAEALRLAAQADLVSMRASAKDLKACLLASGTRLNVKDARTLEFFHSL